MDKDYDIEAVKAEFYRREEERIHSWMQNSRRNARALAHWSRQVVVRTDDHIKQQAVLTYMMRVLSKGLVPLVDVVVGTLEGRMPIPPCGYLTCALDTDDHSH